MVSYMKSLFILLTLLSAFACESQPSGSQSAATVDAQASGPIAQNIDVTTFLQLMGEKPDRQILDVRTPGETAEGIISGALEIDFTSSNFTSGLTGLDKNKPVLIYCRSGNRSGQAMRQMSAMGFKEIYNLNGGVMAWTRSGQPLVQK